MKVSLADYVDLIRARHMGPWSFGIDEALPNSRMVSMLLLCAAGLIATSSGNCHEPTASST